MGNLPVDCVLGGWFIETSCTVTCGGGQIVKEQKILTPNAFGGAPCVGPLILTESCATNPCESNPTVDCAWNDWNQWGACDKCDGQRQRTRTILHMPENFGQPCRFEHSEETTGCDRACGHKKFYCVWSEWSVGACSVTCGAGFKRKERALRSVEKLPPQPGGIALYQKTREMISTQSRLQDLTISFACGFLICFLVFIMGMRMFNHFNRDCVHIQRGPEQHRLINENVAE